MISQLPVEKIYVIALAQEKNNWVFLEKKNFAKRGGNSLSKNKNKNKPKHNLLQSVKDMKL